MFIDSDDYARRLFTGDATVLKDLEIDVWPGVRWRILHRFAGRLFEDDLPDILQDALLTLSQKREEFDANKGCVASWFAGIAFNTAKDFARRRWVRQRQRERAGWLESDACAYSSSHGTGERKRQPGGIADERLLALNDCLAALSSRQRQLLFASYCSNGERPTSRQLAEEFGGTPESVRQEIHRLIARIRKAMPFELRPTS